MIFDGGRDRESLQQRKYPSCKKLEKKHDALGTQAVVRVFAELSSAVSAAKSHRRIYCRFLLCQGEVDRLVQNSLPQSPLVTAPSSEGALDAADSKQ